MKRETLIPRLLLVLCLALATACAPRGKMTVDTEAGKVGKVETIFIGTTRDLQSDGTYGNKRSEVTHFARYAVSVPPKRKLGEINWPSRFAKPDPERDFLTVSARTYPDEPAFRGELSAALKARGGEAVVFVHGYNNNFSEGLYRVAQFAHDLELPGVVVHYAWPSAAEPLGYVYDRDSALFARDGLAALLDQLADAGATHILLVAHSMGSALTMEALRTSSLRGDNKALDRISGVILISPDIDVDVFRAQAKAMGELPQPFVIFGSNRDKILRISAGLTGQRERLGSLSDLSQVADLKVTFLDVSAFASGAAHFTMGDSPALILLLQRISDIEGAFEADRAARVGLLPGVVMTVQSATQVVLTPITTVGNELVR